MNHLLAKRSRDLELTILSVSKKMNRRSIRGFSMVHGSLIKNLIKSVTCSLMQAEIGGNVR